MSKFLNRIKRFMKRSKKKVDGSADLILLNEEKLEENSVSEDSAIDVSDPKLIEIISRIRDVEGEEEGVKGRTWRFIQKHFMNDILIQYHEKYKLKYMKSVENVLQEVYGDYSKGSSLCLDDINQIVFVDIDNWGRFFKQPKNLPPKTYVMCFKGGANQWKPPENLETYRTLSNSNMVSLSKNVGQNKDAADFALTFQCGKQHCKLPLRVGFLIISGDYGLTEVVKQMKTSKRLVGFVNPHQKKDYNNDRHYKEKLDDDHHLLDVMQIMSYFCSIAKDDEEIQIADKERLKKNYDDKPLRFSNMTTESKSK